MTHIQQKTQRRWLRRFLKIVQTGLVPQFPTLIVCGFVVIAAIQSLFSGLILKTIYQKNRQDFEMELYRVTSEMNEKIGKDS